MPIASATKDFGRGDRIEVLRKEDETFSIWFPAVVLRSSLANNQRNMIYVEFETLREPGDDERPLREYIGVADVRPAPPQELHRFFKVGEMVEAFHGAKKGWRKGRIVDILENSKYAVLFVDDANSGSERDVEEVAQWGLRVYRVWDDDSWLPPIQLQTLSSEVDAASGDNKCKIKYNRRRSGPKFAEGMVIEVKGTEEHCQGSWYPATIVELLGKTRFLLEYQTLKAQDESEFLKAEADAASIRPCPPVIQHEPFELFTQVDAWYKDGWCMGHISHVIDDMAYMVCFSNTNKDIKFKQCSLRPHQEWVEGQWIAAPKKIIAETRVKTKELKLRITYSGNKLEQFRKGMMVEVKSDEEGYQGAWYTALIIGPTDNNNFLVEYQTLKTDDESEPLKETARASYIRPCPPLTQRIDQYKMLEEVDAWYNEGWWVGVISKVLDGLKYAVYFWTSNEELEFSHRDLRPHQEWIDGKWITAFKKKSKLLLKSKLGKLKRRNGQAPSGAYFTPEAKVEVRSDAEGYRGSWYPALIVKDLGNGKYLVQYQTLKTDDETELLKEEADAQFIRPAPPVVQQTQKFRPLEEVDAWYNEGWWVGEVCKVLPGSKYSVYFQNSNEVLEFQHSDLRPHQDWINQQWIHTIRMSRALNGRQHYLEKMFPLIRRRRVFMDTKWKKKEMNDHQVI